MSEFVAFRDAVKRQFDRMQKHQLFKVDADRNYLWDVYLKSFPTGTDPIYKVRTEHDCQCCKKFIRDLGAVVAVVDGKVESIWDISIQSFYQHIADALSTAVKKKQIKNKFVTFESRIGAAQNWDYDEETKARTPHNHFYAEVAREHLMPKSNIATHLGNIDGQIGVFRRALNELTISSFETVLELIDQNTLYRGNEFKTQLNKMLAVKRKYAALKSDEEKNLFIWVEFFKLDPYVSGIRNSVIGELLISLSDDVDLEAAVRMYESRVAPTNYKRPTALVTQSMINNAKQKIGELGLTNSFERRHAKASDISVNNILFVDRESRVKLDGGNVFDDLAASAPAAKKNFDGVEEVDANTFINNILPKAQSIELLLENTHQPNFMSLIAPAYPDAPTMFKWNNGFSWTYSGDLTDSIKERVKNAGGNVTGDLCCRLAWFNHDDLDLHMIEPNGYEIYFGNRHSKSPSGGQLDVDMNAGSGKTREPVENIFYGNHRQMKPGVYKLIVNQFSKRETTNVGFEVEIDFMGDTYSFSYPQAVKSVANITVADFEYKNGAITFKSAIKKSSASREIWGVHTNVPVKVNMVMFSPNYWDEQRQIGNQHLFFILNDCKNDDSARGFYNEFLSDSLRDHRKVIELLGSKVRVPESDEQLSGVGFSLSQRNSVLVRVTGSFTRTIRVKF